MFADDAIVPEIVRRTVGVTPAGWARLHSLSNRTYLARTVSGPDLIVRLSAPQTTRFAMEEHIVTELAATTGVPVPTILTAGTWHSVAGPVAYMVQQQLPGIPLSDYLATVDDSAAAQAVGNAGEVLAQIHQVPVRGWGNLDESGHGSAPSLSHWFRAGVNDKSSVVETLAPRASDLVAASAMIVDSQSCWLDSLAAGLNHGDFSLSNILVDGSGTVVGIIDWESAKSGPPGLDFGWWDCFCEAPNSRGEWLRQGYRRSAELDDAVLEKLISLSVIRIMIDQLIRAARARDQDWTARATARLADVLGRVSSG